MRVAVNDAVDSVALERAAHFILIDVHDLRRGDIHRRDVLFAAFAHALREPLRCRNVSRRITNCTIGLRTMRRNR